MMLKIVVIIQARMGSTRLPGKVIKDIHGIPLILRLINNLKISRYCPEIIVATSTNKENDSLELLMKQNRIECFRGDEQNVLSRFITINDLYTPDIIVRATADDPLMSAECMDKLIDVLVSSNADYVFMKDVPVGVSPEVIRASCFTSLNVNELDSEEKEHVTLYFKKHEEVFKVLYVNALEKLKYPSLSLTVDTEEQFLQVEKLYEMFGDELSVEKVIKYVKEKNCNFI